MLAPDMGTLISHGATYYQEHHSRYVNFMRPDALTLAELDLATTSNVIVARNQEAEDTTTATTSNAALRQPEKFYDLEPDEPDGELVDFTDSYRTYQVGDGVYTTVFGGYSGYYLDSDGNVWEVDDTLCLDGRAVTGTSDGTDDDEDSIDMELINDLVKGSSWSAPMIRAFKASASNATSEKRSVPAYENRSGAMQVSIPERITGSEGIQIRTDRYEMEMIPLEGDFFQKCRIRQRDPLYGRVRPDRLPVYGSRRGNGQGRYHLTGAHGTEFFFRQTEAAWAESGTERQSDPD